MDRQQYLEVQAWVLIVFIFIVNCVFAIIVAFGFTGEISSQVVESTLAGFGFLSLALLGLALGLATITKTDLLNRTGRMLSKHVWKQKYRGKLLGILRIR